VLQSFAKIKASKSCGIELSAGDSFWPVSECDLTWEWTAGRLSLDSCGCGTAAFALFRAPGKRENGFRSVGACRVNATIHAPTGCGPKRAGAAAGLALGWRSKKCAAA
jgi:hypothetical protein